MEAVSTPSTAATALMATTSTAVQVNSSRLAAVMELMGSLLRSGSRSSDVLFKLCFSLARGIDFALSNSDVPGIVCLLPSLLKEVYQHRNDTSLQSAITVLMISVKNACRNGWFPIADTTELLIMANELCNSLCMTTTICTEMSNVLDVISDIIPRFYPQLRLCRLIVSFEAKPGYNVLMGDFHIPKYITSEEKIRLFVAQTDNLETSSCLVSPPQVSFLVNGKGVEKRTNIFVDSGPQFPTDITRMLKYGTNIFQAVGYFSGNYILAIAFMSKTTSNPPVLEDYVQPVVTTVVSDSEIIEGPSRVSLNCPISYRRIRTPIKGQLCKHHQCFDYDNFMEMNSRKPSWRCPCCNQPTSFVDLRIDQNMVKVLGNVGNDTAAVFIFTDGSWRLVVEQSRSTHQLQKGTLALQHDGGIVLASNEILDSEANIVDLMDLTMDEDGKTDTALMSRQVESLDVSSNLTDKTYETEDTKPFRNFQGFVVSGSFPEQLFADRATMLTQGAPNRIGDHICPRTCSSASASSEQSVPIDAQRVGTLESLVPNCVLNPVITDAISPAPNRETTINPAVSQPNLTFPSVPQARQITGGMQPLRFGNSITSSVIVRPSTQRQVIRVPTVVQALPTQAQASNSAQMKGSVVFTSCSNIPSSSTSVSYETISSMLAFSDGFNALSADTDMQLVSWTSGIVTPLQQLQPMTQNQEQGLHCSSNLTFQQVIPHAVPTQAITRAPSDEQRIGTYRASFQTPINHQNLHCQSLRRVRTTSQCTSTPLWSSCAPSMQVCRAQQNAVTAAAGNLANQHDLVTAPEEAVARLQSVPPFPVAADGFRLMGYELLHNNIAGTVPVASRGEGFPEWPSENQWRPTGRMRGSLIGSAYSSALNHYLAQPSQQVTTGGIVSVFATSDQQSRSMSNSINAHSAHGSLSQ